MLLFLIVGAAIGGLTARVVGHNESAAVTMIIGIVEAFLGGTIAYFLKGSQSYLLLS